MSGKHITEVVWFNARKVLPDSARSVVVLYRRFIGSKTEMHISEAVFQNRTSTWAVDSKLFNPSVDIVTQWAKLTQPEGVLSLTIFRSNNTLTNMSQTDSKPQMSTIILLALIVIIALCSVIACIFSFQNYYVLRTYTKQVFQSTTEALEAQNAVHKRFVEGLKLIIDNLR